MEHQQGGTEAFHYKAIELGGYVFHADTIVSSWIVMAILLLTALMAKKKLSLIPAPLSLQNVYEMLIDAFENLAREFIGEEGRRYVPFVATIFLFVLLSNWLGLIPQFTKLLVPPSSDYNTTLALAIISFIGFNYFGIQKKGVAKWIKHFVDPVPTIWHSLEGAMKYIITPFLLILFIPLNIIEELARIISLSIRLFGNIMGEHTVMALLVGLVVSVSVLFEPIPLFVSLIGLLAGAIQALIFALLTLSYIAGAVGEHH